MVLNTIHENNIENKVLLVKLAVKLFFFSKTFAALPDWIKIAAVVR